MCYRNKHKNSHKINNLESLIIKELVECDYEFRELDGSNNNKKNPSYGKSKQQLVRLVNSTYNDGLNEPTGDNRASAREISNEIFRQDESIPNPDCITNIFWLWGQFVDHMITLVETNTEDFPIAVPIGDPYFDPTSTGNQIIDFKRSVFDENTGKDTKPREQINSLTPLLDASAVYGSTKYRNKYVREFCGGRLKLVDGKLMPFNDLTMKNAGHAGGALFVGGDIRANEHLGLASIHTLFVREHNHWAKKISAVCKHLCDEQIYQRAKIMVEAEIQSITYNEFLPILLGNHVLKHYNGFNENINPQVANMFSTAAYRFGHSMVASNIFNSYDKKLKDGFFASYLLCNYSGIDPILKDMICTYAEKLDGKLVNDLRNFLFGKPGEGGFDLAALNIQRGRDHGLADYNVIREKLGFQKISYFSELTNDENLQNKLNNLYGSVDNIDLFVGGLLEESSSCSIIGPLFHKIIKEQFEKIRDGDRFWYENRLTCNQIDYINKTTLADIIKRNTNIKDCRDDVFILCECCHH